MEESTRRHISDTGEAARKRGKGDDGKGGQKGKETSADNPVAFLRGKPERVRLALRAATLKRDAAVIKIH